MKFSLLAAGALSALGFAFVFACSTANPVPTAAPAGPPDGAPDTSESPPAPIDAAPAADASVVECTSPKDCVQSGTAQLAGCWACTNRRCEAIAAGGDPNGACATAKLTACTTSTCNGLGACSPVANKPEGTACGTVCSFGSFDVDVFPGKCVGASCLAWHGDDGGLPPLVGCLKCDGPEDTCQLCPPSGCTAKCAEGSIQNYHCP